MINNYSNTAQLKDLMTAPPMTAEQHAEIMRKRNEQRRKIEDAREARKEEQERYGERR
jgi:ketol-acid reductoisomerase